MGFQKVSEMKREVALSIKNFVIGGVLIYDVLGTDSFDIALAAE